VSSPGGVSAPVADDHSALYAKIRATTKNARSSLVYFQSIIIGTRLRPAGKDMAIAQGMANDLGSRLRELESAEATMKDNELWTRRMTVHEREVHITEVDATIASLDYAVNTLDEYTERQVDVSDAGDESSVPVVNILDEQTQKDQLAKFAKELDTETKRKLVDIGKSAESSYKKAKQDTNYDTVKDAINYNNDLIDKLNQLIFKRLYIPDRVSTKLNETKLRIGELKQMEAKLNETAKADASTKAPENEDDDDSYIIY
jgi:hypothetical protein